MVADRALSKQGKYLPGSHIPVINPEVIDSIHADLLLVLPWNLSKELRKEMPRFKLIRAIPEIQTID